MMRVARSARDLPTVVVALLATLLLLLGATGCQTVPRTADKAGLPPLQEGFHWESFPEVVVAVPCPDGWHRAVSRGPGTFTGSVSVEDFNTGGLFKTGFTVQLFVAVKQRSGHPASMLAIAMGQEICDTPHNQVLATDPLKEHGKARSCYVRYRNSPALGNKITVHKFFVAIDSSDLLYIFTFESPNESWDEAFAKYGTPMMEKIWMGLL